MARVDKTEAYLNTLPAAHQDMLVKYRDNLYRIRYCIDENFQIIRKLIEDVGNLFENANQTVLPNPYQNGCDEGRVRTQDLDKVFNEIDWALSSISNYADEKWFSFI